MATLADLQRLGSVLKDRDLTDEPPEEDPMSEDPEELVDILSRDPFNLSGTKGERRRKEDAIMSAFRSIGEALGFSSGDGEEPMGRRQLMEQVRKARQNQGAAQDVTTDRNPIENAILGKPRDGTDSSGQGIPQDTISPISGFEQLQIDVRESDLGKIASALMGAFMGEHGAPDISPAGLPVGSFIRRGANVSNVANDTRFIRRMAGDVPVREIDKIFKNQETAGGAIQGLRDASFLEAQPIRNANLEGFTDLKNQLQGLASSRQTARGRGFLDLRRRAVGNENRADMYADLDAIEDADRFAAETLLDQVRSMF